MAFSADQQAILFIYLFVLNLILREEAKSFSFKFQAYVK